MNRSGSFGIQDGLAMYSQGAGIPVLLMPYPHASANEPMIENPMANILIDLNFRVITFDPPGNYRSTRTPTMTMQEMIECAQETLRAYEITEPVIVVGHSMGGLCSIAYNLAHPERVAKLVLVDTLSGGPAIRHYKAIPYCMSLKDPNFWRLCWWGIQLSWLGRGNLAIHKKIDRLCDSMCYFDKRFAPEIVIRDEDYHTPAPIRSKWTQVALGLDYKNRLNEIHVPTLVIVGRYDLQTPVGCSQELVDGISGAQLEVFERSGHFPFIEEHSAFVRALGKFLVEG
jgi:proline iminopeptidase